jgi:hypothetical protein
MTHVAQAFEKNHLMSTQNQPKSHAMNRDEADTATRRRNRVYLMAMAIILAAATLAPITVLAG